MQQPFRLAQMYLHDQLLLLPLLLLRSFRVERRSIHEMYMITVVAQYRNLEQLQCLALEAPLLLALRLYLVDDKRQFMAVANP